MAIKGFQGFRANSQIHTAKLLRLSENLPIIVEIVDTEDKIAQFLPYFDEIIKEGLATLEDIDIILYTNE